MFSSSLDLVFTQFGFNNWKDIGECVRNHAMSVCHADSLSRWLAAQAVHSGKCEDVSFQLDEHRKEVVRKNRAAVGSLARIAITCARQDIALRGHSEHAEVAEKNVNRGNFLELLELLKLESPSTKANLERMPKHATYCSKDSQNELLQSAASIVTANIVSEVKAAGMFTVIADEARDISKTEQMSICLRYVIDCEIKERFLSFVAVRDDLSAEKLSQEIANCLKTNGLDLKLCIAQCYDGASVMSGEFNGVQEKFRVLSGSPCIYVHCYAHKVNLVLVDVCAAIQPAGDMFGMLGAIHNYLTVSSIRHDKFVSIQQERGERVMELPLMCETRWVCKLKAVTTFKERFESILLTLEFFSQSKKPRERIEAKGLLIQSKQQANVFMLHVFEKVLMLTSCVSTYCQSKEATMSAALGLVDSTISALNAMRNDDTFDKLYSDVLSSCVKFGVVVAGDQDNIVNLTQSDMQHPQHNVLTGMKKRVPALSRKFNDSIVLTTIGQSQRERMRTTTVDTQCSTSAVLNLEFKDGCRKDMFEILDRMQCELKERFSKSKPILLSCDTLNPKANVFLNYEVMKPLSDAFAYLGINADNLKCQCAVAKHMFESGIENDNVKTVVKKLCDMKCAFGDLVTFAQLVLTVPVSSAGAERSFSTMKRVKSYLRSTMADSRLTHLSILSIERALSSQLLNDPSIVVDVFAKNCNRRVPMIID
jgi:hypothetical protein